MILLNEMCGFDGVKADVWRKAVGDLLPLWSAKIKVYRTISVKSVMIIPR